MAFSSSFFHEIYLVIVPECGMIAPFLIFFASSPLGRASILTLSFPVIFKSAAIARHSESFFLPAMGPAMRGRL